MNKRGDNIGWMVLMAFNDVEMNIFDELMEVVKNILI